jgi:hypothetical protein
MAMRTVMMWILLTLMGCTSGPALELMEAISSGEREEVRSLLAPKVTLVTADKTVEGQVAVHAALSALPAGGRASGHHDVAQLVLPDMVLFGQGSDAVQALALLEGAGAIEPPPAALDAYVAAWNEPNATERLTLLDAFAVHGRYVDPTVDVVGREAFAAHLTGFRAAQPATTFERTGLTRRAGNRYLFEWVMTNGSTSTPGTDIIQLDDEGRVQFVAGFF